MTQHYEEEEIEALVKYRMQRAHETLVDADVLIQSHRYNAAINRLYYACFYAVMALLLKHRVHAQTHDGVKQMFGLHFVMTNKIDKQYSRFYGQMFNARISGDYDDFVQYDESTIAQYRPQAEAFLAEIERIISEQ